MSLIWSLLQRKRQLQKSIYRHVLLGALQHLGEDTDIDSSVVIESPERVWIEDGCRIGQGTRLIAKTMEPIGIRFGPMVRIRPYVQLNAYGGRISLGRRVTIGEYSVVCGHGGLTVGENTMISWQVSIVPANHIFDRTDIPLRLQGEARRGIQIGCNAWIGSGAIILDGVTIGNDAVVAAGAVVTHDIPEYAVAMGVPARVVRDRRNRREKEPLRSSSRIYAGLAMDYVDDITNEMENADSQVSL